MPQSSSETLSLALASLMDLWDLAKTELEKYDCSYETEFSDFESAVARIDPNGFLVQEKLAQVEDALWRLGGSKRRGPVPAGLGSGGSVDAGLSVGATANLTYFDVTVTDHRITESSWNVQVTVCYRRAHPDANDDGTTRVSTDPWSFAIPDPSGKTKFLPVAALRSASSPTPTYHEDYLRVGECQLGWISVAAQRDLLPPSGVRYAPQDFPQDRTQWLW